MTRPTSVVILGIEYQVLYCDKPSDVDVHGYKALWGQIDFWRRAIRIYDHGKRSDEDLWETLMHEILHGIGDALKIEVLSGEKCDEDVVDLLAMGLVDTLFRNGWFRRGE